MAPKVSRSRSNTVVSNASSRQTKSSTSTTSDQSASTHLEHHHRHASESLFHVQLQPPNSAFNTTPEEMISRSSHQLQNPIHQYAIDPALQDNISHVVGYHLEGTPDHNPIAVRPPLSQYQSYDGKEDMGYGVPIEEQGQDSNVGGDVAKRKKGSATSQANDIELRKLYRENDGRDLDKVAAQVIENERGPRSEKTKQIFAMLWLSKFCKKSTSSVPRNRVFSHYANRCGTENIPPLNPASFGKLVRIIFPGIQTRRLGVRGESKYHYVELSLEEDQQDLLGVRQSSVVDAGCATLRPVETRDNHNQQRQLPADTALFPLTGVSTMAPFSGAPAWHSDIDSSVLFLKDPTIDFGLIPQKSNMVRRELKFATSTVSSFPDNGLLELPSIHPYVPPGTDVDAVRSLTSVYRSHCNLAIKNFRFCQRKDFWQSYSSLPGLLTVPGQKLLAQPSIAAWIKACDWLKYQKMMSIVQVLAVTKIHPKIARHMEQIATELGSFIINAFQNQPSHVVDAMLGPATVFTSLIDRLFLVNSAAQAAADVLTDDRNRNEMWNEWTLHVKPIQIIQSKLHPHGQKRVFDILTREIHELLTPSYHSTPLGVNTVFRSFSSQSSVHHSHPNADNETTESNLDRWINFLNNLPSRFPGLEARLLLNFVDVIGSAAVRDLSRGSAQSLNGWWKIKIFVDEMSLWLAEKGGFLDNGPDSMRMRGEASRDLSTVTSMPFASHGRNDSFAGSRPRTAASMSMDAPSRFGSVDAENDFNRPMCHQSNANVDINFGGRGGSHDVVNNATFAPDFDREDNGRGNAQHHTKKEEEQHLRRDSTVVDATMEAGLFHPSDMGHNQTHDDSGIGMGLTDDEYSAGKYSGFVEDGVHGSDPADVVVC